MRRRPFILCARQPLNGFNANWAVSTCSRGFQISRRLFLRWVYGAARTDAPVDETLESSPFFFYFCTGRPCPPTQILSNWGSSGNPMKQQTDKLLGQHSSTRLLLNSWTSSPAAISTPRLDVEGNQCFCCCSAGPVIL